MSRVLIVDDEASIRRAVEKFFAQKGDAVTVAGDGKEALKLAEKEVFDVAIVDLVMPKMDGMELIAKLHRMDPALAIVVVTGYGTISSAIEAIKRGAYHYLTKPFDLEDLAAIVERGLEHHKLKEENALLREQLRDKYSFENMIGKSEEIMSVFRLIERVAPTDSTVLVLGESGTGKELVAKALHFSSKRKDKPFVTVNCAAIPEQLLESELFGHVRGAFTGASSTRPGRFDAANGGTIFLDEIGDMSPKLQVKLLRVLQEQTFDPVGSNITHQVDVRVLAATNQNLEEAVKERRFREDLYYRLNVIPIQLPPLRKRKADIPLLAHHFIQTFNKASDHIIEGIDTETMNCLMEYDWPGNIRELENAIERAVVLKPKGLIARSGLPPSIASIGGPIDGDPSVTVVGSKASKSSLKTAMQAYERQFIERVLGECENNRNKAARSLGINRTTLVEKIRKLRIKEKNSG